MLSNEDLSRQHSALVDVLDVLKDELWKNISTLLIDLVKEAPGKLVTQEKLEDSGVYRIPSFAASSYVERRRSE
jgi:hypothetical protein